MRNLALAALQALKAALQDTEGGRVALLLGRDLLAMDVAQDEFARREAPHLRCRWLDLAAEVESELDLADLQDLVGERSGPDDRVLALHALETDIRVRLTEEARALHGGAATQ